MLDCKNRIYDGRDSDGRDSDGSGGEASRSFSPDYCARSSLWSRTIRRRASDRTVANLLDLDLRAEGDVAIGEELRISVSAVTQIADRSTRDWSNVFRNGRSASEALQLTEYGDQLMKSRRAERVRGGSRPRTDGTNMRCRLIEDLRDSVKAGAVLSPQIRLPTVTHRQEQ